MKKVYLLPNIITAFGLACGLFVIFKVNLAEPGGEKYAMLHGACLLLLVAALADLLDGAVARIIRGESEFGFMFDSLADAITFGVAPSVLFLKSLSLEQGSTLAFFAIGAAMIFTICGVLRLVRFNVQGAEEKLLKKKPLHNHNKHFTGLPIPGSAIAAVASNLFLASPVFDKYWIVPEEIKAYILTGVMFFLGYLMVSRWKFPSVKALEFRVPSFQLVFATVLIAVFFLYGILYQFPIMLLASSWIYIVVAMVLAVVRVIAGRRSKTLEDFEPEDEG